MVIFLSGYRRDASLKNKTLNEQGDDVTNSYKFGGWNKTNHSELKIIGGSRVIIIFSGTLISDLAPNPNPGDRQI